MPFTLLHSFVLLAFAVSGFASAEDCAPPAIVLNALDRDGGVASGLRPTDLSIEAGGKPIPIKSITLDRNPRRVLLMLDTSGSMSAGSKRNPWGMTLATASFAVDAIPDSSTAALAIFARDVRRESPDFESRDAMAQRVLSLQARAPSGQTALYRSLERVLDDSAELRFGDVIYLVTDGGNNEGNATRSDAARKLVARGIRVFVFLVESDLPFLTPEEIDGQSEIQGLAESTGGALIKISSAQLTQSQREPLRRLGRQVADEAAAFYRLDLGTSPPRKPTRVKAKIIDPERSRNIQTITYSHEILACGH